LERFCDVGVKVMVEVAVAGLEVAVGGLEVAVAGLEVAVAASVVAVADSVVAVAASVVAVAGSGVSVAGSGVSVGSAVGGSVVAVAASVVAVASSSPALPDKLTGAQAVKSNERIVTKMITLKIICHHWDVEKFAIFSPCEFLRLSRLAMLYLDDKRLPLFLTLTRVLVFLLGD
jgi:hypothetical protein